MFEDKPKLLGESEALKARLKQLDEFHVAPLTAFVRTLRDKMGSEASIPYFDPWDGGIEAEVLFLLEAPGSKARNSGFVSRNNPDETAKNFFELTSEAGIDRKCTIVWNTVPWYIGSDSKIRPANSADIASGIESLAELLALLPRIRSIVLMGRKAQKAKEHIKQVSPSLIIHTCPHPSPLFVNRLLGNRQILLEQLQAVQSFLEEGESVAS
ncbi:MAG: uracil-DNA glycosylase [Methylovulum miyakonense]|uniref:uracil-DNA glycosylase n=1 Tax=Methylovulum miyakonense TaxID=645578 RepID=UPI003BB68BB1